MSNKSTVKTAFKIAALICAGILMSVQATAGEKGFAGYWNSTFGHIKIKIDGRQVSGTYSDGEVEGSISGRLSSNRKIINGTWQEGSLTGTLMFRLMKKNNAFSGYWWKDDSEKKGEWIAVRMGKNLNNGAILASDYEGDWQTNFGRMTINVTENNAVTGTFQGRLSSGKITGKIDPANNTLTANWADQSHAGNVVLHLIKGKSGFSGEWRFKSGKYGGSWYGIRAGGLFGCYGGDCADSTGAYQWADGSRYYGQWKDNLYHGIGMSFNKAGHVEKNGLWLRGIYQGKVLSGDVASGNARLEMPSGIIYEGTFSDYEVSGTGKLTYPNGDVYEGEVLNGLPNKEGAYTWAKNNDQYRGKFKKGLPNGRGVYTFASGVVYEGRFRNGKRHGEGNITWPNGDTYTGKWRRDKASGEGQYSYKNGDVYKGAFKNGRKSGKGVYTFADGLQMAASWQNGKPENLLEDKSLVKTANNRAADDLKIFQTAVKATNWFLDVKRVYKSGEAIFFVSHQKEISQGKNKLLPGKTDIILTYYFITAPAKMDAAQAINHLKAQNRAMLPAEYKIEAVKNPLSHLSKLGERHRLKPGNARVHTIGGDYFHISDQVKLSAN